MMFGKLSEIISPENSVEFHREQILFAKDLKLEIKTTVEEVVKSLEKLDIQNQKGKQALLSQSNCFVESFGKIIYRLKTFVIILQEKIIGKQELTKLIARFVEISYSVQQSFSKDSKELKLKLIKGIQDVPVEAANLLKIIEIQMLHENKQKLMVELSNVLRAVDRMNIYNKLLDGTSGQIKQFFDRCDKRVTAALDVVKDDNNKIVLYHVIHSLHSGCQHMEKVVHYLKAYANQYDPDVNKVMVDSSIELHYLLTDILNLAYKSSTTRPLADLVQKNVSRGCAIMGELEDFLQNNEVVWKMKEDIYVVCSNSLASGNQLYRGLENSSGFMKIKQ